MPDRTDNTTSPEIAPVSSTARLEALDLVFGRLAFAERERRVAEALARLPAQRERVQPAFLLGAWRSGRLVGALFGEVQPGRTALLQMARVVPEEPSRSAALLLQEACTRLDRAGVCLVQVLLEKEDAERDGPVLQQSGFSRLAELFYLVCLPADFPQEFPAAPLSFESYSPPKHARFSQIVATTYQHTLDCPALNGVRRIDDVLAGYRATGRFDQGNWMIARHGQEDVGCLILADHPDHGNMELVYMGLAPTARGHAWGKHLVRHAQWLTARAGRSRLVLAVDANNAPAMRIYTAAGFQTWDRRTVFVRVLHAAGP